DIFAPAAAHIASGVRPEEMGPRATEVTVLPPFRAVRQADGSLVGRVIHIDRFGNLVTDVRADQLRQTDLVVEIRGRSIRGVSETYGSSLGLMAVIGGAGYLEVAVAGGSAARELGAAVAELVIVRGAG
ncbi:MAG TPA: SAM hydroxide adenosyltransferase, partial [Dehalococcoidia bacterium]|nr:SAM hydroxide adenosyltransferase [Dehalococcoidia bacterium]